MSETRQSLSFSLHDEVEGRPLTPQNVDLLTLHQFMGEVVALVQGDFSRGVIGHPTVSIENGSVKLVSRVSVIVAASLHQDLAGLAGSGDLDAISPKRAEVIENWQARADKAGSKRHYDLLAEVEGEAPAKLEVSQKTRFRHLQLDEDKLKALWQKGKKAWAGIRSPTEWVEQLRES